MKKLFLIFILLTLVFTLMSCDDDPATGDEKVSVPNHELIDDLSYEVKDIFED